MPHGRRPFTYGREAVSGLERVRTPEESPAGPMQFHSFDGDYVRRLAEGDRSIEEHFVTYFSELLSIKLRGRVRSRDAMEEIRQETFVRVLQALRQKGGLEHPERLGAFVNSVCNNVLFEKFREEARYNQMNGATVDWPDSRINLDAPLIDQERRRLVESVLAELPRRDQELLRMVFLEEADKAEACERLGVSKDYVRVLLHRALSRFREKLAKRGPTPSSFLYRGYNMLVKQCRHDIHHKTRYDNGT